MSLTANEGMRHVPEDDPFVIVFRKTVRNVQLSYRALGLLTFLTDQAEGWVVRSDQLSKGEGREGREAVRTALRELAAAGHYRLERRKKLNGKWVMGTAISKRPVQQWIWDHQIFSAESRPDVPMIQQPDGSYRVQYPDGTLGDDGFGPTPLEDPAPEPENEPEPEPEEKDWPEPPAAPAPKASTRATAATPTATAPAESSVDKAAQSVAEAPKPDPSRPWTSTECAAHHGISPQAWRKLVSDGVAPEHTGLKGKRTKVWEPDVVQAVDIEEIARRKAKVVREAQEVADWWWEDARKHFGTYVGRKGGFVAMRGMVENALKAGYTRRQCADALRETRQHLPSAQQWQRALGVASNHIASPRPGSQAMYSDASTWGDQTGSAATTPGTVPNGKPSTDTDDVVFGVVKRRKEFPR